MAARRIIIDPTHPAAMTPEQRRAEVARILAAGALRLVEQRSLAAPSASKKPPESSQICLELPGDLGPHEQRG
jgi:hypothetical protein